MQGDIFLAIFNGSVVQRIIYISITAHLGALFPISFSVFVFYGISALVESKGIAGRIVVGHLKNTVVKRVTKLDASFTCLTQEYHQEEEPYFNAKISPLEEYFYHYKERIL